MILEQILEGLSAVRSQLAEFDDSYVLVIAFLVLCMPSLLIWRLWAFTVYPWLYPDVPTYLPYWIPSMFRSYHLNLLC